MTRDEILQAAAHIFGQKGFHAASMQDIAQAVNLQKASLYHHFSSKQEILLALLDSALDMLIQEMQKVACQPLPPEEKLRLAMVTYLQTLTQYQDLSSVLLLEHRSLEPRKRRQHIQRRDRFERLWRELIQQGVEQGVFASQDPALASRALLGVMNWTITWYSKDGPLSAEAIADQFAVLFEKGLLPRGCPPTPKE